MDALSFLTVDTIMWWISYTQTEAGVKARCQLNEKRCLDSSMKSDLEHTGCPIQCVYHTKCSRSCLGVRENLYGQ